MIPAAIFLGLALKDFQKQRHVLPQPANKERELLSAIKANGGSITPAEAYGDLAHRARGRRDAI